MDAYQALRDAVNRLKRGQREFHIVCERFNGSADQLKRRVAQLEGATHDVGTALEAIANEQAREVK